MATEVAVSRERIAVVPHGVDPAGYPAAPPDLVARRRGRGGRFTVGFLSRACPEKGLHVLVDALGRMVAAGRDVAVVAAGATVAAEREYVDTCHRAARDGGVADRFRWLGEVDRVGKLDLFATVDCLALPAVHPEAKGIPALEAFTAGLPIVAADAGAFPEYVAGEVGEAPAGLLHRPADAADLARALGELQDEPERAAEFGRTAFARARDRFTPDRMAAGHEAVYREARRSRA
jgi:D-inositol-3-phosphate glycosyltransferase